MPSPLLIGYGLGFATGIIGAATSYIFYKIITRNNNIVMRIEESLPTIRSRFPNHEGIVLVDIQTINDPSYSKD